MNHTDGMNYAPKGKPHPVVKPGEFIFAAAALDHGHIYGMCNGLIEAGATLKWVWDPDPLKRDAFIRQYPQVQIADSLEIILADSQVRLVAGAGVPSQRCALGLKVMAANKDYFVDKAPLTTLDQLADARAMVKKTGRKYAVYYSERLHVESAVFAGQLVEQGAIGQVIQTMGTGPHREEKIARHGFTGIVNSAGCYAISAATKSNNSCFLPAIPMRASLPARRGTSPIPSIPSSRIMATRCCAVKTVPEVFFAATGLPLTDCQPGEMAD